MPVADAGATDPLEPVAIVYDQVQLALLVSLLEDAGVDVYPLSRQLASMQWDLTLAFGGVRLCVRRSRRAEACALLAQLEPWQPKRALFSGNLALDLVLAVTILLMTAIPPPARLAAHFLFDRAIAERRSD